MDTLFELDAKPAFDRERLRDRLSGLRELVEIARADGRPAFIFVNNQLEGNSPGTIVAITD